jgi:hypothetical protein
LQTDYQRQILDGRSFKDGLLPYVNPPHLTLPPTPLSLLPPSAAYLIWTLGQVALLIWLLRLLGELARSWEPHERWLLLSAVIAFPSLMSTVLTGSFSLFLTVCLMQFYLLLKCGHEGQAGLWLAIGTIKPQAMLLPYVLVLAARRWRVFFSSLLVGGGLAALSVALLGWRTWQDYFLILRTHTGLYDAFGVVPAVMYNLKGTLALILGNDQSVLINHVSYAALMAVCALTFWLWHNRWQLDDPRFELRMALTMLLGLIFSPHVNPQDGLMLVAPATLFYSYLRQHDLRRRAYAAFILSCPVVFLISEFFIRDRLGIRIPVLAMIVIMIWVLKTFVDERRAITPSPITARIADTSV